MSIGPSSEAADSTAARIDSVERTSSSYAPPLSSPATSRARARSRSVAATAAPSAASRRHVALPIPPAAPVTSATLPSSLIGADPSSLRARARADRPDHRWNRRARVRARPAADARGSAGRDRLARRRSRRGGGRTSPREGGRGAGRGAREPGRREARPDRSALRPLPRAVGEPEQPARRPRAGPDPRRRDGPPGGGRRRPGHAPARGASGVRRAAGAGDGAGGRDRGERASQRERRRAGRSRPRARRGHPRGGRQARAQASGGGADRAHPGPASRERGTPRGGAPDRGAHAADHLGERPLQDARRDQAHRAPRRALVICLLAGGTGGAKLGRGVADVAGAEQLTVIANTGDDVEVYGVHVSPDPDLIAYWLAGRIDERGWGIEGDTWEVMRALEAAGRPSWFRLGDADLAMCLVRTEALRRGARLTDAHAEVVRAMGVEATVLPMSDDPVATRIRTPRGWTDFQEFMIVERSEGPVEEVRFDGVEAARPSPDVLEAIGAADAIVIGPSNPVISIGPILAVPGVREAIAEARAPVVAVSPFVGGEVVKGPTEAFMAGAGLPAGTAGAAAAYAGLVDGLVADERVPGFERPLLETDVLMDTDAARRRVAKVTLDFAAGLRR